MSDVCIRKVKVLGDRARKTAMDMGLKDEDLVIVTTDMKTGFPVYRLEKIEGSPSEYIQKKCGMG